jgi:hypothetical protein
VQQAQKVSAALQTFAGGAAGLTTAVALVAAALVTSDGVTGVTTAGVGVLGGVADPGAVAAAAAGGVGGVLQRVTGVFASGLLAVGKAVVGLHPGDGGVDGVTVEGLLVRALLWGLVCVVAWGVREGLVGLEQRFYKGEYPPQRNTDKS